MHKPEHCNSSLDRCIHSVWKLLTSSSINFMFYCDVGLTFSYCLYDYIYVVVFEGHGKVLSCFVFAPFVLNLCVSFRISLSFSFLNHTTPCAPLQFLRIHFVLWWRILKSSVECLKKKLVTFYVCVIFVYGQFQARYFFNSKVDKEF